MKKESRMTPPKINFDHPCTMSGDELSFILDSDDHFHGAKEILIHGNITITKAGTGIKIKCNNMKIVPTGPNEIVIDYKN